MGWLTRPLINTEFYGSLSWKFHGFCFWRGAFRLIFVHPVDFLIVGFENVFLLAQVRFNYFSLLL